MSFPCAQNGDISLICILYNSKYSVKCQNVQEQSCLCKEGPLYYYIINILIIISSSSSSILINIIIMIVAKHEETALAFIFEVFIIY